MEAIKTFEKTSAEYARLTKCAEILTIASEHGTVYKVEDCYFDYGQDWLYTTIIAYCADGSEYQALSPREQEDLLFADDVLEGVHKVVNGYSWKKYCVDHH